MTCESVGDSGEKEILFNSKRSQGRKKRLRKGELSVMVGWTIRGKTRTEQYQLQNESITNTSIYLGGRAGPPS